MCFGKVTVAGIELNIEVADSQEGELAVAGIELNIEVADSQEGKLAVAGPGFVENNPVAVAGSPERKVAVAGTERKVAIVSSLERKVAVAVFVGDDSAACPGTGHHNTGFE